jgi:hypothetical protein
MKQRLVEVMRAGAVRDGTESVVQALRQRWQLERCDVHSRKFTSPRQHRMELHMRAIGSLCRLQHPSNVWICSVVEERHVQQPIVSS